MTRANTTQACYNKLYALSCLPSTRNGSSNSRLLFSYLPPNQNTENEGAEIEEFYTVDDLDSRITLADELRRLAVFKPSQIKSIAHQLLGQIGELKRRGLFHGSIHAHNVAIVRKGSRIEATLINFGSCIGDEDISGDLIQMQSKTPELLTKCADIGSQNDIYRIVGGLEMTKVLIRRTNALLKNYSFHYVKPCPR